MIDGVHETRFSPDIFEEFSFMRLFLVMQSVCKVLKYIESLLVHAGWWCDTIWWAVEFWLGDHCLQCSAVFSWKALSILINIVVPTIASSSRSSCSACVLGLIKMMIPNPPWLSGLSPLNRVSFHHDYKAAPWSIPISHRENIKHKRDDKTLMYGFLHIPTNCNSPVFTSTFQNNKLSKIYK